MLSDQVHGGAVRDGLKIRPEAGLWRVLLGHEGGADARRFREQLGLPVDRPIVMTGHQAQFWHPGILAKYLAADSVGDGGTGGRREQRPALAFAVVDQDRPQRASVRYPVLEKLGNLGVREVGYAAEGRIGDGDAGASVPEFVREGLEAIDGAMRAHASEPVLARRVAFAVRDLMRPLLSEGGRDAALLFATDLCRTELFAELVLRMAGEPERCVQAYNAAVVRHPDAGIRPLEASQVQDRWELPLWHLPPEGPRRHVYAEDVQRIPMRELAPKALFMTGLLRLAGCDLFIHGVGGGGDRDGGYDHITDEWLHAWLGRQRAAPITVVTATRRLPLDVPPPPSMEAAAKAVWRVHHARHHPAVAGLEALEQQRQALVAEIEVATPHVRAELFHGLHAMLERYRVQHAAELDELRSEAERVRARRGDAAILAERTWAFPLYPREMLDALRREIVGAFTGASGAS